MQRLLKLSGNKEKREGGAVRGMIMRRECYLDQLEDRNEESWAHEPHQPQRPPTRSCDISVSRQSSFQTLPMCTPLRRERGVSRWALRWPPVPPPKYRPAQHYLFDKYEEMIIYYRL